MGFIWLAPVFVAAALAAYVVGEKTGWYTVNTSKWVIIIFLALAGAVIIYGN